MIRIRIAAVEICNCGPWLGAWRLEIPDAPIAVLCRPNEQGKSTLLAAVPAVFWGEGSPAKNWFAADQEYAAAVEFERELHDPSGRLLSKSSYRAVRHFETDRASLAELRDGAWQTVPELRDKPQLRHKARGRTADNAAWLEVLADRWVPVSPQSFRHIAVLSQPADWQVDAAIVQNLISGSGNATAEEARARLLERFREISRFSKQAGLSTADARNDGALEAATARRESLQRTLQDAQETLEVAQNLREELEKLEQSITDCAEETRKAEAQKALVDELRGLRRRLDTAERDLRRFTAAHHECEQAAKKLADLQERLAVQPSVLAHAELPLLAAAKQAIEKARSFAAERIPEDQLRERLAEIDKDYASVKDWPEDAAEQIAELHRREQAANQAEAALMEAERAVANMAPVPDSPKRHRLIAAVAGGGFLLGLVAGGLVGGWVWGFLGGIILAAAAAVFLGLTYRPTRENPGRAEAEARRRVAQDSCRAARDRLREIQDAVAGWAGSCEAAPWTQLLQTWTLYREELRRLSEESARQARLREAISLDRLPEAAAGLLRTLAEKRGPDSQIVELDTALLTHALEVLEGAVDLRRKIQAAEDAFRNLLQSHAVRNPEELAERLRDAERERNAALLRLDQLKEGSAFAEELARAGSAELDDAATQAAERSAALQRHADELRIRRNELERELARREGGKVVNVAQCEWELRETEAAIARLERRRDAIRIASELLRDAQDEFSSQHREAMQRSLNELMRSWTEQDYAEFTLDQGFRLSVRIAAADSQPDPKLIDRLSQGARDQLALAVRTAVLDRLAGDTVLPLLLDDPFLTWDDRRRERFRRGLSRSALDRQIILLTHDPSFSAWGEEIVVRRIERT